MEGEVDQNLAEAESLFMRHIATARQSVRLPLGLARSMGLGVRCDAPAGSSGVVFVAPYRQMLSIRPRLSPGELTNHRGGLVLVARRGGLAANKPEVQGIGCELVPVLRSFRLASTAVTACPVNPRANQLS